MQLLWHVGRGRAKATATGTRETEAMPDHPLVEGVVPGEAYACALAMTAGAFDSWEEAAGHGRYPRPVATLFGGTSVNSY